MYINTKNYFELETNFQLIQNYKRYKQFNSINESNHEMISPDFNFFSAHNHIPEYTEYYNTQRITTKLKGLTPVQYRCQSLITD